MSSIKDLEVLTTAMEAAGFRIIHSEAGNMDSGIAQFFNGTKIVSIVKDRGQWRFDGSKQLLEPLGLWRAFNDTLEFREVLLHYIKKRYGITTESSSPPP